MKYTIHVGDQPITLEHENLDRTIDVDALTIIDTSNIFGEHVTMSAAVNRIGLIKAEVEALLAKAKIDIKEFESGYKNKLRKQAFNNSGYYTVRVENEDVKVKISEKALERVFENDKQWLKMQSEYIDLQKSFNQLDVLYWACQDKSRKLNGLVGGTTPEDYIKELVEGKVNGIVIKKSAASL